MYNQLASVYFCFSVINFYFIFIKLLLYIQNLPVRLAHVRGKQLKLKIKGAQKYPHCKTKAYEQQFPQYKRIPDKFI